VPDVQDVVVRFLNGGDVREHRLVASTPHFASIEEASRPPSQRRR
jgi:hypothetical protein